MWKIPLTSLQIIPWMMNIYQTCIPSLPITKSQLFNPCRETITSKNGVAKYPAYANIWREMAQWPKQRKEDQTSSKDITWKNSSCLWECHTWHLEELAVSHFCVKSYIFVITLFPFHHLSPALRQMIKQSFLLFSPPRREIAISDKKWWVRE